MTSLQQNFKAMASRSLALHGFQFDEEGRQIASDKAVKEFLTSLAGIEREPQKIAQVLIDAWEDKTGNLQRALNAERVIAVGNFIAAESTFKSMYFEEVSLKADEQPYVENETENEIRVTDLGEDGKPDQVRVVMPQTRINIGLYFLTSEIVKYKTVDVYKGDVSAATTKTLDIARDVRFRLDRRGLDFGGRVLRAVLLRTSPLQEMQPHLPGAFGNHHGPPPVHERLRHDPNGGPCEQPDGRWKLEPLWSEGA